MRGDMRTFMNKWFHHWARGEGISDGTLVEVAKEIAAGQIEADLGGYLFKKRLQRQGRGKSSGYRTIVGYKRKYTGRIIFLYGFAKSQKVNITTKEEAALSLVAGSFLSASDLQIETLLADGTVREITAYE
jgi:hypothetical protein